MFKGGFMMGKDRDIKKDVKKKSKEDKEKKEKKKYT
jgi:hypothetical protein